jgi:CubicO group peptidase (beta-lactamase class C family)
MTSMHHTPLGLGCGLAVAVFLVAVVRGPSSAQTPAGFEAAWSSLVEDHRRMREEQGVVGGTLAFVAAGRIIAADYHGMADLESGRAVDESTIYHWASVTKTFTGVAVLQLRDHGVIELDDPVVRYVPELRGVHNRFGSMEDVTIRHLLSHSAGFRGPTWPWGGDQPWHPHEPTEWSQLVAMIPYTELLFEPGTRYSYSNPGIIFLGRTIEAVTGDVYEAYIDKNIFDVLGMDRSYFDTTPWHLRPDRSNNYVQAGSRPEPQGLDFNTGITVSNGGLNAPVGDMARWIGFLSNAPAARGELYDRVLSRSSLEEMWEPVVTVEEDSELGPVKMGLTFFLYDDRGHRVVGHTGSQKAFRSFIFFDPATGAGIMGAYNTTAPRGDQLVAPLDLARRRALDALFPLFREPETAEAGGG